MRHSKQIRLVVLGAVLCIMIAVVASYGEFTHSTGGRLWIAEWESFGTDLGSSTLAMLYYSGRSDNWSVLLLGGIGSGWEGESSRTDIQGALTYTTPLLGGAVRVGGGYHYIVFDFEDIDGFGGINQGFGKGQALFHGPEISASYHRLIGDSGLGVYLTGTVLPFVLWSYDEEDYQADDNDGSTRGYSVDTGGFFSYNMFTLSIGYRLFSLAADKGNVEHARSRVEETFQGPSFQYPLQP